MSPETLKILSDLTLKLSEKKSELSQAERTAMNLKAEVESLQFILDRILEGYYEKRRA